MSEPTQSRRLQDYAEWPLIRSIPNPVATWDEIWKLRYEINRLAMAIQNIRSTWSDDKDLVEYCNEVLNEQLYQTMRTEIDQMAKQLTTLRAENEALRKQNKAFRKRLTQTARHVGHASESILMLKIKETLEQNPEL